MFFAARWTLGAPVCGVGKTEYQPGGLLAVRGGECGVRCDGGMMGKPRRCRKCGHEFTGFACPRCHPPRRQGAGGRSQGAGGRGRRFRASDVLLWAPVVNEDALPETGPSPYEGDFV